MHNRSMTGHWQPAHASVLGCVDRATRRASDVASLELGRGLRALAIIAYLAPWVGILGTCILIVESFRGCCGEKSAMIAAINASLAAALWPTVFGVFVAIAAFAAHRYFIRRIELMGGEMESTRLALLNQLASFELVAAHRPSAFLDVAEPTPEFCEQYPAPAAWVDEPLPHSAAVSLSMLAALFLAVAYRFWFFDSLPFSYLPERAFWHLVFTFIPSALIACAIWTQWLQCRPGYWAPLAVAVCAVWNLLEVVL